MTSIWHDTSTRPVTDSLHELPSKSDVIVAGAGIAGLVAAVLLSEAGLKVTLVEARSVAALATGNTTAKFSLLQGSQLSSVRQKRGAEIAAAYVDANRAGLEWTAGFCESEGVAWQTRPAINFATTRSGARKVDEERAVAEELGLPVETGGHHGLPFSVVNFFAVPGNGQLDPYELSTALVARARRAGAMVFEGVTVTGATQQGEHVEVQATTGRDAALVSFSASHLILATGFPVLDRGLHFTRLTAHRSHLVSFRSDNEVPTGMYLSMDTGGHSYRQLNRQDGDYLLVGGAGHQVGASVSSRHLVDELIAQAHDRFTGLHETHRWAAQDYTNVDATPLVGPLDPRDNRILSMTGFAKWGMTNGVAAAHDLTARILGNRTQWMKTLYDRSPSAKGALGLVERGAHTAARLTSEWGKALTHSDDTTPAEGEGRVGRDGVHPVATSTVGGQTRTVSAVCPHLGGVVVWNDESCSWDCPLHASRFAPDGTRLEGPATTGLANVEKPQP
ncbi:FAD-dependent oxidoreductase [Pseudoclavibacter helvolus]|uniref:FAD-dependent oxidoreductase n=1 Tax=Pseudoclavibacter helvolus TaxID=255205 RepID=UPI003C747FD6